MRTISFHKKQALCLFCKKNPVEKGKELRACEECKKKRYSIAHVKSVVKGGIQIGKRMAAAIWENEKGEQVAVDKFGKPVSDHGYDTKNDPRGWDKTGTRKAKRTIL